MNKLSLYFGLLLAQALPGLVSTSVANDVTELRDELQLIKKRYQSRIKSLEKRIAELEKKLPKKSATAKSSPGITKTSSELDNGTSADKSTAVLVNKDSNKGVNKGFNPNISLILNGSFNSFSRDPEAYQIPGFVLAPETGPGEKGFSLNESELVISANIDQHFFGRMTIAVTAENEVEVEEAFLRTLSLPGGVSLQAGRFFSEIGYLNSVHSHAWDFVDAPLAYRALLGNRFRDDGVQLRWLAPLDYFVEIGLEAFKGDRFPMAGGANNGQGAYAITITTGGDLGSRHSWQAGFWLLEGEAVDRVNDSLTFNGDSRLYGIDIIAKFNIGQAQQNRKIIWLTEFIQRDEKGIYSSLGSYNASQSAWYTQLILQMNKWRVGARYDELQADNPGILFANSVLDPGGHTPKRVSVMLDYSLSEYSRWRLQYNRDDSDSETDHQWYLQYIMSMGAHKAHRF